MSHFKTVELSDPRFESGGLRMVTAHSPALDDRTDVTVHIPEACKSITDVPVVPICILLHGIYGSHWAWAMKGGAHVVLDRMIEAGSCQPMLLAMPSDGLYSSGSGYLKHQDKDYESWIVQDLPLLMQACFPCVSDKSPIVIGGLSMGGFGALRLAAKYPEIFKAASGHSSATDISQLKEHIKGAPDIYDVSSPANESVFHYCQLNKDRLPPFRFDCGKDDFLFDANVQLAKQLTNAHIPHEFEVLPGEHDWDYWHTNIHRSYAFFDGCLR